MTIKELVKLLNKRYKEDSHYISSIIEDIDEYVEMGESYDIKIEVVTCEKEEIETGLWEYVATDAFDAREYAKNPAERCGYVVDITFCDGILEIWFVPGVTSEDLYLD